MTRTLAQKEHVDPEYEECLDEKGYRYIKIVRTPKKETIQPKNEKEETTTKLSEKQVYDLVKSEQVSLLEKLGQTPSQIRKLRYEQDRVNKILELQK